MTRPAVAVVLVLSIALLAACGSGGDDPDEAAGPRPSAGCGPSSVAAGEDTVDVGDRRYIRHVPPRHGGDEPVPVVIDLHGYAEGADIHTRMSALGAYGDEQGFVTITPQGLGDPVRWDVEVDGEDVRFLRAVLDDVERSLCVDRDRVYATGLSNGAMMASALACALPGRIAAVAPVAGVVFPGGCSERAVPIVAFHGTADRFIGYEGGVGEAGRQLPAGDGSGRRVGEVEGVDEIDLPAVPDTMRRWARHNGCGTRPIESEEAEDVTYLDYPSCDDGADVELWRIEGGGHTWPGSELGAALEDVVGRTTTSIRANEVLWRFFVAHPLSR